MNVIAPDIGKCVTNEKISGGNLLPSLGGTGKIFADQDDFFLKKFKIPIFAAKISDDLFLVIDQVLRIFPDFPDLYFVRYRTQPFPRKKTPFFHFAFFPFWQEIFF